MRAGSQLEDADTSSPAAFQLVGAWMHRCLHHHPSCPNSSLPTLPTRVLDVGLSDDSTTLRLREGNSERAFYTTLSYRWDQTAAQHFQTTKSNLAAHQEQIDYSMLSQNMKDAVAITRKLGVQYLWIDALCIIQDSPEDWAAESSHMARIYKNSLLTIAAATIPTKEHQGCFQPRTRRQIRPFNSGAPFADGRTRYIFADRRATGDGTRPRCPLDTRAWVLQEQVLSARVLSYTATELYWDCITHSASETFPDGIPAFYEPDWLSVNLRSFKQIIFRASKEKRSRLELYSLWRSIIESYSKREMTNEADKLIAILGVAQEASIILNDRFAAGLWAGAMSRDLLWWVKDPRAASTPTKFEAPSWSWASVNAEVSYQLRGHDNEALLTRLVKFERAIETTQEASSFHVRGEIVARGLLIPFSHLGIRDTSDSSDPWAVDQSLTRYMPDSRRFMDPTAAVCLPVSASPGFVYSLALGVVEISASLNASRYRRIGLVTSRASPSMFGFDNWYEVQRDWAQDAKLKTIIII